MKQNIFSIESNYYEQQEGRAMEKPLSRFRANLLKSKFHTKIRKITILIFLS